MNRIILTLGLGIEIRGTCSACVVLCCVHCTILSYIVHSSVYQCLYHPSANHCVPFSGSNVPMETVSNYKREKESNESADSRYREMGLRIHGWDVCYNNPNFEKDHLSKRFFVEPDKH